MARKFRENIFVTIITSIITILLLIPLIILVSCTIGYLSTGNIDYYIKVLWSSLALLVSLSIYLFVLMKLLKRRFRKNFSAEKEEYIIDKKQTMAMYDAIRQQHQKEKENADIAMMESIKEYMEITLSPYMKESSLTLLYNNVCHWHLNKSISLAPVSTDGKLTTLDLRHLVWNIGERCGWRGEDRALFIKQCFPLELKEIEVETIRRNLRQKGTCSIDIDIPEKNSYLFHYPANISLITHTA